MEANVLAPGDPKEPRRRRPLSSKKTRAQTTTIVDRAIENGDLTPLSAMLDNPAVISAQANKLVQDGVPLH